MRGQPIAYLRVSSESNSPKAMCPLSDEPDKNLDLLTLELLLLSAVFLSDMKKNTKSSPEKGASTTCDLPPFAFLSC